jgi:hypothetical protein
MYWRPVGLGRCSDNFESHVSVRATPPASSARHGQSLLEISRGSREYTHAYIILPVQPQSF